MRFRLTIREQKTNRVWSFASPIERSPFGFVPPACALSGAEHRSYLTAKRYTGIFWTKTRDEVANAVRQLRLELIGRDDSEAACRRNGTTIELLLESPRADEALPLPVGPAPLPNPP